MNYETTVEILAKHLPRVCFEEFDFLPKEEEMIEVGVYLDFTPSYEEEGDYWTPTWGQGPEAHSITLVADPTVDVLSLLDKKALADLLEAADQDAKEQAKDYDDHYDDAPDDFPDGK